MSEAIWQAWFCASCRQWEASSKPERIGECTEDLLRPRGASSPCPECDGQRVRGARLCKPCADAKKKVTQAAHWAHQSPEARRAKAEHLVRANKASPAARRYFHDDHYFDAIDTPDKAYWLGFIAGDGGIHGNMLLVSLARRDEDHLYLLATALRTTAPLHRSVAILNGKTYPRTTLRVTSTPLTQALERHGIRKGKTDNLQPWPGPGTLIHHYWRGLVDADGHVSQSPRTQIELVGTLAVVDAFGAWARTQAPGHFAKPGPHGSIWRYRVGGKAAAQVAQALYAGAPIALARKAERARVLAVST